MKLFSKSMLSRLTLAVLAFSVCACQGIGRSPEPTVRVEKTPTKLTAASRADAGPDSVQPRATPTTPPTATAGAEVGSLPPTPTASRCDSRRGAVFHEGLIGPVQGILDALPGATVYHLEVEIAGDLLSLSGHESVCYTNLEGDPLDEVVFRLFPNLLGGAATVSNLRVDGDEAVPRLELADSALWVPLGEPLQPGESAVIEMDFEVDVAQEMAGNYGLFGFFDGVLSLHEVYPVIPVYDDEGWNVELPPPRGDITYYDAAFYQVDVTAPARLTLVASGVEVAHEEDADSQSLTFAAGPARGFYLAASEHYRSISTRVDETTVNSYALAGDEEAVSLALDVAARALDSYGNRFGPYPYTEFDVVSTPMQALGMEYPGIVTITSQVYDLSAEVRGLPAHVMMESTIGHEVAHQWFYNVVGNDQIDEPWLDEALVQYVTGLYYRDTYGEQGYDGWRESWYSRWDGLDRAEIPIGLPVRDYEAGAYGAIVYGRGPLFVEALAEEMGQDTFDAFLRDYYQSRAWDIGTGEAFRQLAEQHCQCDLSALFEEWVYPDHQSLAPQSADETAESGAIAGWAVLAEKDDYSDVDMTDLPVDYIGIAQMRERLESAGWDPGRIRDLKEFDQRTLRQGLDWLEEKAGEDDLVLVYVAAHGRYLSDVVVWESFFADEWAEIPSPRRVLIVDACHAADFTDVVKDDPAPYVSIAAVDEDEYGWTGLEEEGLPVIGGVFTHYFAAAFEDPGADEDGDGCVSVQEAALLAEEQQRTYMQDVVFDVPAFLEMYHQAGTRPDEDATFPDVIVDDSMGAPLCLELTQN